MSSSPPRLSGTRRSLTIAGASPSGREGALQQCKRVCRLGCRAKVASAYRKRHPLHQKPCFNVVDVLQRRKALGIDAPPIPDRGLPDVPPRLTYPLSAFLQGRNDGLIILGFSLDGEHIVSYKYDGNELQPPQPYLQMWKLILPPWKLQSMPPALVLPLLPGGAGGGADFNGMEPNDIVSISYLQAEDCRLAVVLSGSAREAGEDEAYDVVVSPTPVPPQTGTLMGFRLSVMTSISCPRSLARRTRLCSTGPLGKVVSSRYLLCLDTGDALHFVDISVIDRSVCMKLTPQLRRAASTDTVASLSGRQLSSMSSFGHGSDMMSPSARTDPDLDVVGRLLAPSPLWWCSLPSLDCEPVAAGGLGQGGAVAVRTAHYSLDLEPFLMAVLDMTSKEEGIRIVDYEYEAVVSHGSWAGGGDSDPATVTLCVALSLHHQAIGTSFLDGYIINLDWETGVAQLLQRVQRNETVRTPSSSDISMSESDEEGSADRSAARTFCAELSASLRLLTPPCAPYRLDNSAVLRGESQTVIHNPRLPVALSLDGT